MAGAVLASLPITLWWVIGRAPWIFDTDYVLPEKDLIYIMRPIPIPSWAEHLLGTSALVVFVTASASLLTSAYRRPVIGLWWVSFGSLFVAGAMGGVGSRALTAGTSGANIGGGAFLVAGIPTIILLVVFAAVVARDAYRQPQSSRPELPLLEPDWRAVLSWRGSNRR